MATADGYYEEALELLRNSLAAAPLTENEHASTYELTALDAMANALLHAKRYHQPSRVKSMNFRLGGCTRMSQNPTHRPSILYVPRNSLR